MGKYVIPAGLLDATNPGFGWTVGKDAACASATVPADAAVRALDGFWIENAGVANRFTVSPNGPGNGSWTPPAQPEKITGLGVFCVAAVTGGSPQTLAFLFAPYLAGSAADGSYVPLGSLVTSGAAPRVYGYVYANATPFRQAFGVTPYLFQQDGVVGTSGGPDASGIFYYFGLTRVPSANQAVVQVNQLWIEIYTYPDVPTNGPYFGQQVQAAATTTSTNTHNCPPGQVWNADVGGCVPTTYGQQQPATTGATGAGSTAAPGQQTNCGPNQHWDANLGQCVANDPTHTCPTGQHWDATSQQCIPNFGTAQGQAISFATVPMRDATITYLDALDVGVTAPMRDMITASELFMTTTLPTIIRRLRGLVPHRVRALPVEIQEE